VGSLIHATPDFGTPRRGNRCLASHKYLATFRRNIMILAKTMRRPSIDEAMKDECRGPPKRPRLDLLIQNQRKNGLAPNNRVHFDADPANSDSVSVQVIETLVPALEMLDAEKDTIWYPRKTLRATVAQAEQQAKGFAVQRMVDLDAHNYSETLTTAYASCTVDDILHEEITNHCVQCLALSDVNIAGESTRGLEKIASPVMGQDMKRRRKETIESVLLAQFALRCGLRSSEEKDEILRVVSEGHSKCLRRYAMAMGSADALSAMFEYDMSSTVAMNPSQLVTSDTHGMAS